MTHLLLDVWRLIHVLYRTPHLLLDVRLLIQDAQLIIAVNEHDASEVASLNDNLHARMGACRGPDCVVCALELLSQYCVLEAPCMHQAVRAWAHDGTSTTLSLVQVF